MPGMDRTGPFGTGPIGRGMGPCGGGLVGFGRGRGFRRGGGLGWQMMPPSISIDQEKEILEKERASLETQLDAIIRRIQEIMKT